MIDLWAEKYRPDSVDDYVFSDPGQKQQVEDWIKQGTIGHLLFSGSAGIGKTTLAKILIKQLGVEDYDVLQINASRDNGVDFIKERIEGFVQTIPFGKFKVVLLDECLDENTLVTILRNNEEKDIKIKDLLDESDLVKSFNINKGQIEWKSFTLFYKGVQDTLEIEFENGEIVVCTPDHKWYVEDINGDSVVVKASELHHYMHVLTS